MRLTLRTLLAYLDDTLPPDQAREIGQKVAESHVAQELIERIKKVTRRRGLTVPPTAGPDRIDANTIAEYLDNDLAGDKVAGVEELALNSDVVLAEVAASHQILTLVLGEPAHVPPTARERMYQLVKGRESIQGRRATRVRPAGIAGEIVTAEERRARRRGLVYLLIGTTVLGAALGVALWKAWPDRTTRLPAGPVADNTPANPAPPSEPATNPEANPPQPRPADPETNPPAVNLPEPTPPTTPPLPEVPPAVPKPPELVPDRSPSTERREAGKLNTSDVVLLARDGESWTRVPTDAPVRTTMQLLDLPGYHSELRLESGARLTLWGSLPELLDLPVLESAVTLHAPPAGFDLDFTLQRGRVYLAAKPNGPTKARVRFADQIWDVALADEKSELMLDVFTLYSGEPFHKERTEGKADPPLTQASLGVIAGKVDVIVDGKPVSLQAPPGAAGLSWSNKGGGAKPLEFNALPPFWAKAPARPLPRDRQQEIDAALRRLQQRAADKDKPVEVAVAELGQETSRSAQVLAVYCQEALGNPMPLLDALEEVQPELRLAAVRALQHFSARKPDNDDVVFKQLQARKGFTEIQADRALRLLHGFAETELADPTTYEQLINDLRNDRVGVRELASWRLGQADPDGARIARFNATDPDAQRDGAIAAWKKRIPAGSLPPRGGPQGGLRVRPPLTRGA